MGVRTPLMFGWKEPKWAQRWRWVFTTKPDSPVHSTPHTADSAQYTVHSTPETVHSTPQTVHSTPEQLSSKGDDKKCDKVWCGDTHSSLRWGKRGAGACERVSVCAVTSMVGRCGPGVIVANSIISRLQAENIRNIYFYCRSRVNETWHLCLELLINMQIEK